jgi:Chaperone for flagella basal body P-ring formation
MKSSVVVLGLLAAQTILAAVGTVFTIKKDFSSGKKNICLNEIIGAETLAPREAEKLARYCQITLKTAHTTLSAKEIELHAWAAGVIPDKISGSQIVITKSAIIEPEKKTAAVSTQKIRRGSPVQLILKSEHMQIAREAVVLMDAFPGEEVDVRPHGTRKTLRARLVDTATAEMIP